MLQQIQTFLLRLWRALACPGGVHYIAGAPSLPPPLTPEEEKAAAGPNAWRAMRPHGTPSSPTTCGWWSTLPKNTRTAACRSEDMISIGTIGLIKAVNTFTPARNIKLATYASRCIGNEILMYLRKSSNRRQEASIDEPLNTDGDGNELLLSDVLGSDENQVGLRLEQDAERATLPALGRAADAPGAADHGAAVRAGGRRRAHPEGSRRHAWAFPRAISPGWKSASSAICASSWKRRDATRS